MPDASDRPWWHDAIFYQIYPRSFCDTSGNGIGDLGGIRDHLDHLVWLGVDALWLSPVFPSPMADHGYDVADYCDIDPLFGSLDELDLLVDDAHQCGLRVLLDWVPCHTSEEHPWFLESRSSRDSTKRDWYVWHEGEPGEPPTDWKAMFPPGVPAWTWDEGTRSWYYHRFTPQQPDLNWANPAVQEAMFDTLRFWLDRGIDGFRLDVVHNLGKDLAFLDGSGPDQLTDHAATHSLLRRVRRLFDGYPGERIAVGETFVFDVEQGASYVGSGPDGDELHLGFDFVPQFLPWEVAKWRSHIAHADAAYSARGAWPTWAFSSHDVPRVRTRVGSDARARAAAVLLFGLRGTPFIYAGEELGLEDPDIPAEMAQDPGGYRDGCRAPLPWNERDGHGWAGTETWLPFPPDAGARSVARQQDDASSMLHLFRRLVAVRGASPALSTGTQVVRPSVDDGDPILVLERHDPASGDVRIVALNFSDRSHPIGADALGGREWIVEVTSDPAIATGAVGEIFGGTLAPDQALILAPGPA